MVNYLNFLLGFTAFLKTSKDSPVKIDNFGFRLHYRFTACFMFLSTAFCGMSEIFGKNIQCQTYSNSGKITSSPQIVNQYCFISGTYTIPKDNLVCQLGNYNGDDHKYLVRRQNFTVYSKSESSLDSRGIPNCVMSQSYYQWVPYIFAMIGFICLVPHHVWKTLEEGKMDAIADGVSRGFKKTNDNDKKKILDNLIKYIVGENKTSHKKYAYGYLFSLFLNIVTSSSIFCILDEFINGQFANLGTYLIRTGEVDGLLKEIFPRITSCIWRQYGKGGGVETKNNLCLLSSNIVIEKIFLFLWFWVIFLIITSILNFLYYILMIFSENNNVRQYFLAFAARTSKKKIRWESDKGEIEKEKKDQRHTNKYLKTLNSTDFFFLYGIARNVDSSTLKEVLRALALAKEEELRGPTSGLMSGVALPSSPTSEPNDSMDDLEELIERKKKSGEDGETSHNQYKNKGNGKIWRKGKK